MAAETPALNKVSARIGNRYECIDLLGMGAMGTVYRAIDHELGAMQVAIKFLHPHLLTSEATLERFRKEVLLTRRLGHPNIVRVYEFGRTEEKQCYVIMEYVPGASLGKLLANTPERRLPVDHATRIMYQISSGMAHAHANRIVHRDIKPENIIVDPSGQVKICDFGIARVLEDDHGLTRTGASIGTPSYMAPEQFSGETADERTDVYAMGILGYQLVSGVLPFSDEVYFNLAHKHLHERLPPFPKVLEIPNWYEEIIQICASKTKSDRYSSAEPVRELFHGHLDDASAERFDELVTHWHIRESERLKKRRNRQFRFASRSFGYLLLGIALVLVGISVFLSRQWWLFGTFVLRSEQIVGPLAVSPLKALMGISSSTDDESFRDFLSQMLDETTSFDVPVKSRSLYQLRMLLDAGANTNIQDSNGVPFIILLARKGLDDSVWLMLEKFTTNPNVHDTNGNYLIHAIVQNHAFRLLERLMLLPDLDINVTDSQGNSAMHLSVLSRNPTALIYFLSKGSRSKINFNLANKEGYTALHLAVMDRSDLLSDVLKPLIENSDLEMRTPQGKTALHLAAESQVPERVRLLLEYGADPLARDNSGRTPLDRAFELGDIQTISALVEGSNFDDITREQLAVLVTNMPQHILGTLSDSPTDLQRRHVQLDPSA